VVSHGVLHSNIVSFYLRQDQQIINKVQDTLLAGHEILIGPIAYYEVKRGLLAIKAERRLMEFTALCKVLGVGQLNNSLLDFAADIYSELRGKGKL
jgi:tRNA(fMet)-specific endonuclease VapC